MPTFRHGDATIHYEEFGRGFPILTFAPAGKTEPALTAARARVGEFLAKHTPRN